MEFYTKGQFELIQAKDLTSDHWLVWGDKGQALWVGSVIETYRGYVYIYPMVKKQSFRSIGRTEDMNVTAVYFDETGNFYFLRLEVRFPVSDEIYVLKPEFAPPRPKD